MSNLWNASKKKIIEGKIEHIPPTNESSWRFTFSEPAICSCKNTSDAQGL